MSESLSTIFSAPAVQGLKMAMEASAARHAALSANIANLNTPGYHRVDLTPNFKASFDQTLDRLKEGASVPPPAKAVVAEDASALEANQTGNNVHLEGELVGLMNNDATFEFASRLLAKQYSMIRTAATGRSTP